MSKWYDPMLATLSHETFNDPEWIYERKLDGERVLVFKDGKSVRLMSRNGLDLSTTYPELVEKMADQCVGKCVLDGEVVAFSGKCTSFSRLQKRMQIDDPRKAEKSSVGVYLYLFDILYVESVETLQLPLRKRKEVLRRTLCYSDPIRFTAHRNEQGTDFYEQACEKGWEGLIAKDAAAPYSPGRSQKWQKFKCINRQELVIGGWTEPRGERNGFGALLVGYYDGGAFYYAGKVGTGYNEQTLTKLRKKMSALERRTSPFDRGEEEEGRVHYVTPKLVAEVGFTEWTKDGRLRHPRYLGLRRDKAAEDVIREN